MLYWITNPLWVGGTLCFLASAAFSEYFIHLGGPKIGVLGDIPIADLLFKLAFIWFSIVVAIAALEQGKWIPNFGALCRALVLAVLLVHRARSTPSSTASTASASSDFIPGATSIRAR